MGMTSFVLLPFKDGVRIIDAKKFKHYKNARNYLQQFATLEDAFNNPNFNAYFISTNNMPDVLSKSFLKKYEFKFVSKNKRMDCNIISEKNISKRDDHYYFITDCKDKSIFRINYPCYVYVQEEYHLNSYFVIETKQEKVLLTRTIQWIIECHLFPSCQFDLFNQSDVLRLMELTSKESDCVFLMMQGMTAKMIASKLNISFRSVEYRIAKIKQKLNLSKQSDIIRTLKSLFS